MTSAINVTMKDADNFQEISLDEMMSRIKTIVPDSFDMVVAIARGGILPGYLIAKFLDIPLEIIHLNLRNDSHQQIRTEPLLLKPVDFEFANKRIILTDDVSNTGLTMEKAKKTLQNCQITTLVISGNADISLFGPHNRCINWPWSK